ncbi:MAG TPA: PHP domain-containing protein [Gaiellaceae bacterium]|nr:PHP domain-containing protein [Gaiellaceae bacterium]
MTEQDPFLQDMHVHSTFSDGANTIDENLEAAGQLGLVELTCVDHVRASTDWVPDYVDAVRTAARRSSLTVHCAVEAKILDTSGRLDLPPNLGQVDAIYAADHQVPLEAGPVDPVLVRTALTVGETTAKAVLDQLVTATCATVQRYERVVVAHLFSVLPKLGLRESDVPLSLIEALADAVAGAGAKIEIDERWRCPSPRTLRPFVTRGVPVLLSTDSHRRETIGRYDYCASVVRALRGRDTDTPF